MLDLHGLNYSEQVIKEKREGISQRLMALSPNIPERTLTCLTPHDLRLLFELYDEVFMQRQFAIGFHGKLKFSLSRRLTRSAGKTLCTQKIGSVDPEDVAIEIRMGVDFFFNYDAVESEKKVNGLPSRNALEAFQLVFEHELCHAIEFINFHQSSCRQKRFKTIAHNIFGHKESYHQLPTRGRIAQEKLGLSLGDIVTFMDGVKRRQGMLYRINKRAIVMVRDKNGRYTDNQGIRYRKCYVPLEMLNS